MISRKSNLNPEFIDKSTVLVACTNVSGDRIQQSEGFDLIRTSSGWNYGTFNRRHIVQPIRKN
jgi:hypothetical protein